MFEYKTMPLDKTRVLMMNGIYKLDVKDNNDEFIRYNDFFKRKTFYQCPKCKSLNVEVDNIFSEGFVFTNTKQCSDCGHSVVSNFGEDKND